MNQSLFPAGTSSAIATPSPTNVPLVSSARCARPGCPNDVVDPWDDAADLCGRCALEQDLFDRDSRRDRTFAA